LHVKVYKTKAKNGCSEHYCDNIANSDLFKHKTSCIS